MTDIEKKIQVAHLKRYMWFGTHLSFNKQSLFLSQLQSCTQKLETGKLGFSRKIHEFNQKIPILKVLRYDLQILTNYIGKYFAVIHVIYFVQFCMCHSSLKQSSILFLNPTLKMQKICMIELGSLFFVSPGIKEIYPLGSFTYRTSILGTYVLCEKCLSNERV